MAFAIGHISGCHLNPAISIGLWAGGSFEAKNLPAYIAAQLSGAILTGGALYVIASGVTGWVPGNFASNCYGEHSLGACRTL